MEKSNTKQAILDAALELFSVQGFAATSISQIADAVGIKKASLYFHFESKQNILDELSNVIDGNFYENSIFAKADWNNPEFANRQFDPFSVDEIISQVKSHMQLILHNPQICRIRKMHIVEQFQNERLAEMQTKHNYTDVLSFYTGMMQCLVGRGILKDYDPEIMACQFAFPITVWISLCDREPEREAEIMPLLEKHVRQFFDVYCN